MGGQILQGTTETAWTLAARQHGVVSRNQLLALGFSAKAIEHRIAKGRLHRVRRGVYAAGRPQLTVHGRWMAAVLACGPGSVLSHETAAALWEIRHLTPARVDVSVPATVVRRPRGIAVHRRPGLGPGDTSCRYGIPVTTPVLTLVDLATRLDAQELEAAVNEADKQNLIDPERLRAALDASPRRTGIRALRAVLDRRTFTLTDSKLERRFLRLARAAGLPLPLTGQLLNGVKVDFHWPAIGLVVETDGLRYHRTPGQQAHDRRRDQAHTAAGLTQLRFTHGQIASEPHGVVATLRTVARRLQREGADTPRSGKTVGDSATGTQ